MLEAFIWMFKANNFKENLRYLILTCFKFLFVSVFFGIIGYVVQTYFSQLSPFIFIICYAVSVLMPIFIILFIQGYFWELTAQVIDRKTDIKSASIYNGKLKKIHTIELPELNTKKFIWRGFASFVATLLMFYPFAILFTLAIISNADNVNFYNVPYILSNSALLSLPVLFFFLVPPLLWNYAKQDSIIAVWNIRKAIYIMGNYTGQYLWNLILFLIYYVINYITLAFIYKIILEPQLVNLSTEFNFWFVIISIVYFIITYSIYLYSLYVYAYLLGTIAPSDEN